MKKGTFISIFKPIGGIWKSLRLKHWDGKRVTVDGVRGYIVERQLDRDFNFRHWIVRIKGEDFPLYDPNYPKR